MTINTLICSFLGLGVNVSWLERGGGGGSGRVFGEWSIVEG